MNFFSLITWVRSKSPEARVVRVSVFATGVVSVAYVVEGRECALHVWPDGRYVFRPSEAPTVCDGGGVPAVCRYLQENAAELWLLQHVGHTQALAMADNVRVAKRELDSVCRPWTAGKRWGESLGEGLDHSSGKRGVDDHHYYWPLAYAMAVVQRVSGVRYGVKALHVLSSGSVVASVQGGQQVMLTSNGAVYVRQRVRQRTGWQEVVLDKIGALLHHNWCKAVRFVLPMWRKTMSE